MQDSAKIVSTLSEYKEDVRREFSSPQVSLLSRINNAKTVEEVNELLQVGGRYVNAKPKTLKMWARAAAEKVLSLQA